MLPREHRLTASRDFSVVMRRGSRSGTSTVVVSVLQRRQEVLHTGKPTAPHKLLTWRCGFVVSKAVGNSVVRHTVQRRLRHIVRDLMGEDFIHEHRAASVDIVIRALDRAPSAAHQELSKDVESALIRSLSKLHKRQVALHE